LAGFADLLHLWSSCGTDLPIRDVCSDGEYWG